MTHDDIGHRVLRWAASAAAACLVGAAAQAQPAAPQHLPTRGELLYTTHCVACHTTQMHWRDQKLATDWPSLKAQVQRWQANARLQWSDDDVTEVARFLNDTIYRYPQTSNRVSWAQRGHAWSVNEP